jgi:hypothetical protein
MMLADGYLIILYHVAPRGGVTATATTTTTSQHNN